MYKNQCMDYGNLQYKAVFALFAKLEPDISSELVAAAAYYPTLHPDYADTYDALEREGDIIEVFLALGRAADIADIRALRTQPEWVMFYTHFEMFCNAMDVLKCHLIGGVTKRHGDRRDLIQLPRVPPAARTHAITSGALARVVYRLWCA